MKNNFIFLAILSITLISLVGAFESPQYNISTDINTGGINVGIGDDITVNITTCTLGETTCDGTTYYVCSNNSWLSQGQVNGQCGYSSTTTTSGGGGGGGGSSTSLLSAIQNLISPSSTEESSDSGESSPEETIEEIPKEETSSRSFLTGAVTGVTDFAKSPAGKTSLVIGGLIILGAVFVISTKKPLDKKSSAEISSEQSKISNSMKEEALVDNYSETDNNLNE